MTGVAYKASDGVERTARAHLTIVCDGMYSGLRKHLSEPKVGSCVCACACARVGACTRSMSRAVGPSCELAHHARCPLFWRACRGTRLPHQPHAHLPPTAPPQIHHPSYFVGVVLRNAKLPYPNHGHVVLAKPSPILFYPISSTEVRWGGSGCSAAGEHAAC